MTPAGGLRLLALGLLPLLARARAVDASPAPSVTPAPTSGIEHACANALSQRFAPDCANNSTLYALLDDSTETTRDIRRANCASCMCNSREQPLFDDAQASDDWRLNFHEPWGRCCDGWAGTQCDQCTAAPACPRKRSRQRLAEDRKR